ncbi:MAG TPA: protein ndvB, partial [Fimbriimonadaceae bacterium]|nr:protein ndvB [Fimbriimonadaceae bacterium]
ASADITFLLGAARSQEEARTLIHRFGRPGAASEALRSVRDFWDDTLGALTVETPNRAANLMLNRWLLTQVLSCRLWGRSGFYQSGGAYGFRDQLQDVLALLYSQPALAREHLLRSAARQFVEGDVQHWWHSETGAGVRTRISDDLLWLPYATARYVEVTGDASVLDETAPFLEGRLLDRSEHDAYFVPTVSPETATLWEHCRRAIEKGATAGAHGLPLIGGGDWNDGLDRVGANGQGESVWLAWFLVQVFHDFAAMTAPRDPAAAEALRKRAKELAAKIEKEAWDGEWYRRAYFDDGTPLGSKTSPEAQIDSLPQSWAAITGAGSKERARQAMRSVSERLVRKDDRIVLLFTPPFDESDLQPGYIKGYPPGVRENGGQYTHGSLWTAMAWARLGDGAEAVELLDIMNPVRHASNPDLYLVEPYAVAADIYALPGRVGMGGWTWYTGSASWLYRIWIEEVLGFKLRGNRLTLEPVMPPDWPKIAIRYRYRQTNYLIEILSSPQGEQGLAVDGSPRRGKSIDLVDDGVDHIVR